TRLGFSTPRTAQTARSAATTQAGVDGHITTCSSSRFGSVRSTASRYSERRGWGLGAAALFPHRRVPAPPCSCIAVFLHHPVPASPRGRNRVLPGRLERGGHRLPGLGEAARRA